MKNLFKILSFFIPLLILNVNASAQRVEVDSTESFGNTKLFVNSDSLLVDEILYGNKKELIIITKSSGEVYIDKPKVKKFISVDVK